ncbi:oxidoreductase-like protein [Staphylotrichum tortipilum]|uniref:Oxidoreductase-like protein n=1 Tax=Staphylotrichum tortipilum TaxID=2831512 RepID=A0AAN6MN46_9PEZI|nr:oxidoreductase-like protein [Staphylotrichum longicolle]
MRRTIIGARPAHAVYRAFGGQQARRSFAATSSAEQVHPVGPFYEAVLRTPSGPTPKEEPPAPPKKAAAQEAKPAPKEQPAKPAAAAAESKPAQPAPEKAAAPKAAPTPAPTQETKKAAAQETKKAAAPVEDDKKPAKRARKPRQPVIFGSKLAGPAERAERLARMREQSRLVAGVLVPPKPDEPDNCCMSGCVNCVWDRYRDEMEEWAAKSAEAERRLKATEVGEGVGRTQEVVEAVERGRGMELGVHEEVVERGGEGGVGSDGGRVVEVEGEGFWDEELYKNLPVGIREFMKQEKRLKEKHLREGTLGG